MLDRAGDPETSATGGQEAAERCRLHVELEVGYGDGCVFSESAVQTESVDLFVFDDTCNCKYSVGDDEEGQSYFQVTKDITDTCVCYPFCAYGCVPTVEAVQESTFIVSTHVPDREVLRDLVDALKTVSDRVRLLRIVEETGDDEDGRSVAFDLTMLTDTQRETLELAVTHGYYDDPRGISLGELASMLDVSKSALSRRLSNAEAKLVSELVRPD